MYSSQQCSTEVQPIFKLQLVSFTGSFSVSLVQLVPSAPQRYTLLSSRKSRYCAGANWSSWSNRSLDFLPITYSPLWLRVWRLLLLSVWTRSSSKVLFWTDSLWTYSSVVWNWQARFSLISTFAGFSMQVPNLLLSRAQQSAPFLKKTVCSREIDAYARQMSQSGWRPTLAESPSRKSFFKVREVTRIWRGRRTHLALSVGRFNTVAVVEFIETVVKELWLGCSFFACFRYGVFIFGVSAATLLRMLFSLFVELPLELGLLLASSRGTGLNEGAGCSFLSTSCAPPDSCSLQQSEKSFISRLIHSISLFTAGREVILSQVCMDYWVRLASFPPSI